MRHHSFFQEEDGIRDVAVTGVQTCALPILVREPEADDRAIGHHRQELLVAGAIDDLPDKERLVVALYYY